MVGNASASPAQSGPRGHRRSPGDRVRTYGHTRDSASTIDARQRWWIRPKARTFSRISDMCRKVSSSSTQSIVWERRAQVLCNPEHPPTFVLRHSGRVMGGCAVLDSPFGLPRTVDTCRERPSRPPAMRPSRTHVLTAGNGSSPTDRLTRTGAPARRHRATDSAFGDAPASPSSAPCPCPWRPPCRHSRRCSWVRPPQLMRRCPSVSVSVRRRRRAPIACRRNRPPIMNGWKATIQPKARSTAGTTASGRSLRGRARTGRSRAIRTVGTSQATGTAGPLVRIAQVAVSREISAKTPISDRTEVSAPERGCLGPSVAAPARTRLTRASAVCREFRRVGGGRPSRLAHRDDACDAGASEIRDMWSAVRSGEWSMNDVQRALPKLDADTQARARRTSPVSISRRQPRRQKASQTSWRSTERTANRRTTGRGEAVDCLTREAKVFGKAKRLSS